MRLTMLLGLLACGLPGLAFGWGHTGHVGISTLAMQSLPEEVPALLRAPASAALVGSLGPELDISKGSGAPHDNELDPGHYVDLDEQGRVFGILPLAELPATREAYDTRLRAGGHTQYTAGYLPYSLVGGWQQLRKDFAWVRVAMAGLRQAENAEDRAFFEAFLARRQALLLHNIGIWSHYVADASQPLHVSVHFNGWGNYPNPRGYTQARTIHARFESDFVRGHIRWEAVAAALPGRADCDCTIQQRVQRYLGASLAQVEPLYALELTGAFAGAGTPEGLTFVTARLAAGAAELRDLIVDAWRASATAQVGYPVLSVAEIEAGRLRVTRDSFWRE